MEDNFVTLSDAESKYLDRIMETDDPEELKKLADGLATVHDSIVNESHDVERLENEKKKTFWSTLGTIVTGVLATGGVIAAAFIKGEYDMQYQDNEIREEKTENYLGRGKTRHRRPR